MPTNEDVVNAAFEAFCTKWQEEAPFEPIDKVDEYTGKPDLRCGRNAWEMLVNYVDLRRPMLTSPDFRLIAYEQPFAVPLTPNDRGPIYVGRFDKVFEYQGRTYIGEHKTTTAYKKNGPFTTAFVESFSPNSQIDGYLYASHLIYGKAVKAVWVDAALVHAAEHGGFRLIPVERQFEQLAAWHWETLDWIERIEENKRRRLALESTILDGGADIPTFLTAFPKNTSACSNYGQCSYLHLCKSLNNPEIEVVTGEPPLGFEEKKWEPFNEILLGQGSNVPGVPAAVDPTDPIFDNTRISSFRSCQRSFYFRHVRHLSGGGTSRALIFGSSWHNAMDVVWSMLGER